MSDKPILFSAPMVRALLAGTKTQTRRIFKPQPTMHDAGDCTVNGHRGDVDYLMREIAPAYGLRIAKGDRLYVRESWNWTHIVDLAPGETLGRTADECAEANNGFACACGDGIVYAATNAHEHPVHGKALWKSSMFMPRWASRLTLHVTDVRVQRLHEISEEDAIAEGCPGRLGPNPDFPDEWDPSPVEQYRDLWNEINGTKEQPDPWSLNPWVAAYTFTVERCNIAQAGSAA